MVFYCLEAWSLTHLIYSILHVIRLGPLTFLVKCCSCLLLNLSLPPGRQSSRVTEIKNKTIIWQGRYNNHGLNWRMGAQTETLSCVWSDSVEVVSWPSTARALSLCCFSCSVSSSTFFSRASWLSLRGCWLCTWQRKGFPKEVRKSCLGNSLKNKSIMRNVLYLFQLMLISLTERMTEWGKDKL